MALQPPNPNIEHPPSGPINEAHQRDLARKLQQLQDFICGLFPLGQQHLAQRTIAGDVTAEGAAEDEGFTAEKTATGKYTVKFTAAFASTAKVTANHSVKESFGFITPIEASKTQVKFEVRNSAGELKNEAFQFIAVG